MSDCPMCEGIVATKASCSLCIGLHQVDDEIAAAWRLNGLSGAMQVSESLSRRIAAMAAEAGYARAAWARDQERLWHHIRRQTGFPDSLKATYNTRIT